MTDTPDERKRKSNRFLWLGLLAALIIAAIAWATSRDSNDGEVTGVTETGVPVFENTPPSAVGTGTTSRDLPGAPDTGSPTGAVPGGDGVAEGGSLTTGGTATPPAGTGTATTNTAPQ
jgi:hypothetical protein